MHVRRALTNDDAAHENEGDDYFAQLAVGEIELSLHAVELYLDSLAVCLFFGGHMTLVRKATSSARAKILTSVSKVLTQQERKKL